MRFRYLESHPKTDGEPQGLLVFDGNSDEVWKALKTPDDEAGISTAIPQPRDLLLPDSDGRRANLFVGFSQIKPSDAPEITRWAESLLPGIQASYWGGGPGPSLEAISRVLLNQEHPPNFFLDGEGFALRVDALMTARPVWVDDSGSALGKSLHFQPVTLALIGGCVFSATHSTGVDAIDAADENARPMPFHGAIMSGPDPEGVPGFLSDFLLDLLDVYGAATRELTRQLDGWESDFFTQVAEIDVSAGQTLTFGNLREIQRGSMALEDALVRLLQEELPRISWSLKLFDDRGGEARGASAVAAARGARESFRESLALASSVLTTQQLQLARAAEAQGQRLQHALARLTAFLLIPALVATVFGANVWLPGHGGLEQFLWMVGAMTASATVSYLALRHYESK